MRQVTYWFDRGPEVVQLLGLIIPWQLFAAWMGRFGGHSEWTEGLLAEGDLEELAEGLRGCVTVAYL